MSFTNRTINLTKGVINWLKGCTRPVGVAAAEAERPKIEEPAVENSENRAMEVRDMLNTKVPGCRLISILGYGGMGTVFLARQENLDRLVAVKMLNRDLVNQPEFTEGLLREAKIMGGFSHPNLVNCHDVIQNKDGVFIIMEYIPGHFCGRDIVRQLGVVPELYLVRTLISVCHALDYIRNHGFLHLDMKPDNLLFYRDSTKPPMNMAELFDLSSSRVAVCDFGIAMQLKEQHSIKADSDDISVMGSPFYMSPEQIMSPEKVDFRSDMYSLAATSWYFLEGKDPYEGMEEADMLRKKVQQDFEECNHFEELNINPRLMRILARMSKVNIEDRYSSYDELLHDLDILEVHLLRGQIRESIIWEWMTRHLRELIYGFCLLVAICMIGLGLYIRYLEYCEIQLDKKQYALYWNGSYDGWSREIRSGYGNILMHGVRGASELVLSREVKLNDVVQLELKCQSTGSVKLWLETKGGSKSEDDGNGISRLCALQCAYDEIGYTANMEIVSLNELGNEQNIGIPGTQRYLDEISENAVGGEWLKLQIERKKGQFLLRAGNVLIGVVHLPDNFNDDSTVYLAINDIDCEKVDIRNVVILSEE